MSAEKGHMDVVNALLAAGAAIDMPRDVRPPCECAHA
jgi:hypothetical protein